MTATTSRKMKAREVISSAALGMLILLLTNTDISPKHGSGYYLFPGYHAYPAR